MSTQLSTRRPHFRLSTLLLCLVLAVLVPALAIGIAAVRYVTTAAQAAAQARLSDTAQALALAVDREISGHMTALAVLATSPAFSPDPANPDLPVLYAQAKRVAARIDSPISLFREDGTALFNTQRPLGEKLPLNVSPETIRQVFNTGSGTIGPVVRSPITGRFVAGAYVPVKDAAGNVVLVILRAWDVEKIRNLFVAQGLPPNTFAGVVDARHMIVARSDAMHDQVVGQAAPAENATRYALSDSGLSEAVGLDGRRRIYAFHHVPSAAGWIVAVAQPAADLNAVWRQPLLAFGLGSAGALALGVFLAYLAGRQILNPLQQLGRHANAIAASDGEVLDQDERARNLPSASVVELEALRQGFAAAEEALNRRSDAARISAAALADSEAKFRAITDAMPQMVWSARPDGYRDYFNQRWYDLTGTAPSHEDGWVAAFHGEDQDLVRTRWQHAVQTGQPYEIEARLRMADGHYRWMLGRARADRDPATGAVLRWFGTCTDIQEAIEARQALARSREDLEQRVEARTRDLQATQTRLAQVQRMEALGQLAGGIAHDFNNVLQSVQGGGALIERRASDPDAVRRLADMVIRAAERGAAITQRLLAFSRRSELRAEPVDIVPLLTGIQEILEHTLGAGIDIRLDLEPDVPPLLADKAQLETVLINLATNARDAMAGKGTLTLAAAGQSQPHDALPTDLMNLKAGTRYGVLSVSDTGCGMDAATLARVTEPFFTTKAAGKGTGLGLSMARGFAEQSDGGLDIRSTPGKGTTVELWLPAASGAQPALASPPAETASRLGGKQIRLLLVDDEIIVREILAEQMQAEGCTVLTAETGDAALALLDAGTPVDLVISDLSMPGMDGVTLIQEAQKRRPRLPAILLTGYATNAAEIAVGGAISGAFTLLRKPVEGTVLAERMAVLLEGTIGRG